MTIACIASGEAAEKLRYEEIPNRLAPFGTVLDYRGFRVITLDGKAHGGRRLRLESDHVRIFHLNNSYDDLASEQIARASERVNFPIFIIVSVPFATSESNLCSR